MEIAKTRGGVGISKKGRIFISKTKKTVGIVERPKGTGGTASGGRSEERRNRTLGRATTVSIEKKGGREMKRSKRRDGEGGIERRRRRLESRG